MSKVDFMTPQEVVAEMKSGSLLSQIRTIVSSTAGEIESGLLQRKPLSIIEIRNIEFDASIRIAALLNVELKPGVVEAQDIEGPTPK